MEQHINIGSGCSENYFPQFVLALRDFTIDLVIDDKEITADEYLEHCLKSIASSKGWGRTWRSNITREYLKKYFKFRKCFTFDRPTTRRKLNSLEQLEDSELSEDFVEEIKLFTQFVYTNGQVKTLHIEEKDLLRLKGKGK